MMQCCSLRISTLRPWLRATEAEDLKDGVFWWMETKDWRQPEGQVRSCRYPYIVSGGGSGCM